MAERPEIDRWILSLLNTLVKTVTEEFDGEELHIIYQRKGSEPNFSIVSNGSTALPLRLLIFSPFLSSTRPLETTALNAGEPNTIVPMACRVKNFADKGFVPGDYSAENYEKIDLHRPYVDDIVLVSPTGKPMYRQDRWKPQP